MKCSYTTTITDPDLIRENRAILLGTLNTHTNMKKFLERLDWIIDFYFVIFLYNPHKVHRYHEYMTKKWGDRYESPSDL